MGIYNNVYLDGDHAAESDVREDVVYNNGNLTGTLVVNGAPDYPVEDNVIADIVYANGAMTGNYQTTSVDVVLLGETFGPNGSLTGTVRQPLITQVQVGVLFGPNDSLTGTLIVNGGGAGTLIAIQDGGELEYVAGDTWSAANGTARAVEFDDADGSLFALLSTGTIAFSAARPGVTRAVDTVAGSATVTHDSEAETTTVSIQVEPTDPYPGIYQWRLSLSTGSDPDAWTFSIGCLLVRKGT